MNSRFTNSYKPSKGEFCNIKLKVNSYRESATPKIVWNVGSWIPKSKSDSELRGNIGSYTGKETMLLVGCPIGWLILHALWKNKNFKSRTIFFWMFSLLVTSTAMCWPPLFPYWLLT
jgi:hypothetical protein